MGYVFCYIGGFLTPIVGVLVYIYFLDFLEAGYLKRWMEELGKLHEKFGW